MQIAVLPNSTRYAVGSLVGLAALAVALLAVAPPRAPSHAPAPRVVLPAVGFDPYMAAGERPRCGNEPEMTLGEVVVVGTDAAEEVQRDLVDVARHAAPCFGNGRLTVYARVIGGAVVESTVVGARDDVARCITRAFANARFSVTDDMHLMVPIEQRRW